jgi:hypothetical protein
MCKHVPFLKCIFNYIIITSIISLLDRNMYIVDDVLKTALLFCVIFTVLLQDTKYMSVTHGVHRKICSVLMWED